MSYEQPQIWSILGRMSDPSSIPSIFGSNSLRNDTTTDFYENQPLADFDKGVNIAGWLQSYGPSSDVTRRAWFSDDIIQSMYDNGVRSVRIISDPAVLTGVGSGVLEVGGGNWTITQTNKTLLQDKIQAFIDHGITVMLDLCHIAGDTWHWSRIVNNQEPRWKNYLLEIANMVTGFPAHKVALELANEIGTIKTTSNWNSPGSFATGSAMAVADVVTAWKARQEEVISNIRPILPNNWIIATTHSYSGPETLAYWTSRIGDTKTAIAIHCYSPFWFTHAGSPFSPSWPMLVNLSAASGYAVPYPATTANTAAIRTYLTNGGSWVAATILSDLGDSGVFGENEVIAIFQTMKNWSNTYNQSIVLNEIGSLKYGNPKDRSIWYQHYARNAIRFGIPVMWFTLHDVDYRIGNTYDFGLFTKDYLTFAQTAITELTRATKFTSGTPAWDAG